MKWVAAGHCWCATHFIDRYRKSENVEHQRLYLTKPKEEKLNSEPPQEEKRVIILDI